MEDSKKAIKNLAQTCVKAGILPAILGVTVVFVGVVDQDYKDLMMGLFMLIVGYSFYKIGKKIEKYM